MTIYSAGVAVSEKAEFCRIQRRYTHQSWVVEMNVLAVSASPGC